MLEGGQRGVVGGVVVDGIERQGPVFHVEGRRQRLRPPRSTVGQRIHRGHGNQGGQDRQHRHGHEAREDVKPVAPHREGPSGLHLAGEGACQEESRDEQEDVDAARHPVREDVEHHHQKDGYRAQTLDLGSPVRPPSGRRRSRIGPISRVSGAVAAGIDGRIGHGGLSSVRGMGRQTATSCLRVILSNGKLTSGLRLVVQPSRRTTAPAPSRGRARAPSWR